MLFSSKTFLIFTTALLSVCTSVAGHFGHDGHQYGARDLTQSQFVPRSMEHGHIHELWERDADPEAEADPWEDWGLDLTERGWVEEMELLERAQFEELEVSKRGVFKRSLLTHCKQALIQCKQHAQIEHHPTDPALRHALAACQTAYTTCVNGAVKAAARPPTTKQIGQQCAICHEKIRPLDDVFTAGCGHQHFFHVHCIEQWVQSGHETCPVCRNTM